MLLFDISNNLFIITGMSLTYLGALDAGLLNGGRNHLVDEWIRDLNDEEAPTDVYSCI